jgi:hypothetical protein
MAKKVARVKVVRTKNGVKRVKSRRGGRVSSAAQAKQAQNQSLVTVEDSTIKMIMSDPRYIQTIPCLAAGKRALASVGRRCGRCDRRRKQLRADAINQIKGCIAGLRGTQATQFKKLLGAKKVRVYQGGRKGQKPVPVTF